MEQTLPAVGAPVEPTVRRLVEPVTLADVLDALNVFHKPRPREGDEPWTEADFISVKHLPDFINIIAVAWFAPAAEPAPTEQQATLDRLNSERLDLALLVGRLIHRMRAARDGRGVAAGDEALEQQAIGYLRRKGLISPLREDGPNADLSGRTRSA